MTDSADLERRYRRLLACYPPSFRRAHEEEICVLMTGAEDGRSRPGLAESADLIRNAVRLRLRPGATTTVRTLGTLIAPTPRSTSP